MPIIIELSSLSAVAAGEQSNNSVKGLKQSVKCFRQSVGSYMKKINHGFILSYLLLLFYFIFFTNKNT